ncbi:MAG: hypothetical protein AABX66_04385 [Nanoarchaeota archaeon]
MEYTENLAQVIIFDTSFILNGTLSDNRRRLDGIALLNRCRTINSLRNQGTIIPIGVKRELGSLIGDFVSPEAMEGKRLLSRVYQGVNNTELNEDPFTAVLIRNIIRVSKELSEKMDVVPLSDIDTYFCAQCFYQLKSKNVVAVTRDSLIRDVLSYSFGIAHSYLLKNGAPDTSLYFARNERELYELVMKAKNFRAFVNGAEFSNRDWSKDTRKASKKWVEFEDPKAIRA